jgi:uncharacterized protein YegP (UPF0339 family)
MRGKQPYVIEVYRDAKGEHRWRMKASNGRIVADSGEGYGTHAAAHRAAVRIVEVPKVIAAT